jgi:hypothetical protein
MIDYTVSVAAAQTSIYKGAGHIPFWETAPRFNSKLAQFVTQAKIVRC